MKKVIEKIKDLFFIAVIFIIFSIGAMLDLDYEDMLDDDYH